MFEFKLPDLGEGIHEAEIVRWHVAEGDAIKEDGSLVDVETDKATVTIPSPKGGKVIRLIGKAGDTIRVGQVLAVIDDGSGAAQAPSTEPAQAHAAEPAPGPTSRPPLPGPAGGAGAKPAAGPVPAAPATRRLARELGVDLRLAVPSGPGGRVTPEDVRKLAANRKSAAAGEPAPAPPAPPTPGGVPAAAPVPGEISIPLFELEPMPDFERWGGVDRQPLRSIRRKIARKMVTSAVVVPHVGHADEADVTDLETFRSGRNEKPGEGAPARLTLLAFVVKAVASGLKKMPMLNASLDPFRGEIVYKKYCNIGMAVATDRGLIVPVIKDADHRSIRETAAEIHRLAEAARGDRLGVEDLQGGTFTITNIGALGGFPIAPIINYPEAAILGMGMVQDKPVAREGQVVIRKMLPLVLAFDHRIADGADAARFVSSIVGKLSDPGLLLIDM